MREWFKVEAAAKGQGGGEILIYSHIGKRWSQDTDAVDAKAFVDALGGLVAAGPGDIHIRINSPGGDVGAGMTIYNALRNIKARVVCTVEGYAYSMASVIALGGRETRMADTAQFMVHNPSTLAYGGQKEMERAIAALKTARATLIKAYSKKTGKSAEAIEALMDETTFMTADEAKEFGFVDVVVDGGEVVEGAAAACFDAGAWAAYHLGAGPMPLDGEKDVRDVRDVRDEKDVEDTKDEADALALDEDSEGGDGVPVNNRDEGPMEVVMLTAKQIREACPGASAEFVLEQVEACEANENRTLVDVLKAHNAVQAQALAEANAAKAESDKRAAEAEANAQRAAADDGVAPLAAGGATDDGTENDIVAQWDEKVDVRVKKGMTKAQAVRDITIKEPEFHKSYLRAYNEQLPEAQ